MLPLLASFIPGLPSLRTVKLVLVVAALIASFSAGLYVRGWIIKRGEIQAYKEQLDREREQSAKAQTAIRDLYEAKLKVATRPKVVKNEIIQMLPADCDLGPDVIRVLNDHRINLPDPSP